MIKVICGSRFCPCGQPAVHNGMCWGCMSKWVDDNFPPDNLIANITDDNKQMLIDFGDARGKEIVDD